MAQGIIKAASLPASAQSTALKLAHLGYHEGSWRYVHAFPLGDVSRVVQIRDTAALAPPMEVAKYADIIRQYTNRRDQLIMPPVVYTRDGYTVDGNTRIQAAYKANWASYPAFILNVAFEDAPQAVVNQLIMLGTMLNLTHGRGLSAANIEQLIITVTQDGDSPDDVARKLQISKSTVQNVMSARRTRERAERLNIPVDMSKVTRTHLAELGGKHDKMGDRPFSEMLKLIQDAGLSVTETRIITRMMVGATSDEDKLAVIAQEKASRGDVIAGNARKPSRAAQLRQHLGMVLKHKDNMGLLVETNLTAGVLHAEVIAETIKALEELLPMQRNHNSSVAWAANEEG